MLDPQALYEYSLSLDKTSEGQELQQRLQLFQVFSRLYEQNQDLLSEVLALESSDPSRNGQGKVLNYIQGVALGPQAYILTNLLEGRTQALSQPQQIWTIGRDSHQVQLPLRDKRLSRRHALIQYCDHEFRLIDLGSTNGSFVNGERVRHQCPLRDGDRVRLGSMTFSFFICREWRTLSELPPDTVARLQQRPPRADSTMDSSQGEATVGEAMPPQMMEETLKLFEEDEGGSEG